MVELYGKHFIYNDTHSRQYHLIFANVETTRMLSISGQKEGRFVFNNALKSRHLIGDKYEDSPLTFEVEIVTCDGHAIEYNQIREIERWLFVNSAFKKLYIDQADDPFGETTDLVYGVEKNLYFNARFKYPEKIEGNGGVVGFRCVMETDSMMMWQDTAGASFDLLPTEYIVIGGETRKLLRGDLDFDGQVTPDDALILMHAINRIIVGDPSGLTEEQELAADMDGDGSLTARDVLIILKTYNFDVVLEEPVPKEYIEINHEIQLLPDGTKVCTVDVDTDLDGYTYPKITLFVGSTGGQLSLINYNDNPNRETLFEDLAPGTRVVLDSSISRCGTIDYSDGQIQNISMSNSLYNKMTKKNFPRMVQGENQFGIIGDIVHVAIEWNNRRFL